MIDTDDYEDNWKHIPEILPLALEALVKEMREEE